MLKTIINNIEFKNPIIAASGTFGFGLEYNQLYDVGMLGGISTKGLTLIPKQGNKGIRIYETASGMMNSVGLQNPGVEHFIKEELPEMQKLGTRIIANLGGSCEEDYIQGVELLSATDVDMIELNISCPNVKAGGMAYGIKSSVAYDIVKKVKTHCLKPLIVKLSPNAESITDMAEKCVEAGADALSLVNTFKAMAVDIHKKKPVFENVYAGLSGAAIKPIALRMVHEVVQHVSVPVIGIGGIRTITDIIEFIMCGATAIQIGSANFSDPLIAGKLVIELEDYCQTNGFKNISEIRGII